MRNNPNIILWGGGSKARIVAEMISEGSEGNVILIFDETREVLPFEAEATFLSNVNDLKSHMHSVSHYVVCIGGENGYARVKTAEYLEEIGLKAITLIHPKGFVEPTARVGRGCQIMPFAVVHKFSVVGDHTIINTNATVDHECVVGSGVHVMGSAAITGKVEIGDYATIGTNSTVLPRLKVGEGAYIGAGAVVTKDVPPYAIVAGVPAKVIGRNEFRYYDKSLLELLGDRHLNRSS